MVNLTEMLCITDADIRLFTNGNHDIIYVAVGDREVAFALTEEQRRMIWGRENAERKPSAA